MFRLTASKSLDWSKIWSHEYGNCLKSIGCLYFRRWIPNTVRLFFFPAVSSHKLFCYCGMFIHRTRHALTRKGAFWLIRSDRSFRRCGFNTRDVVCCSSCLENNVGFLLTHFALMVNANISQLIHRNKQLEIQLAFIGRMIISSFYKKTLIRPPSTMSPLTKLRISVLLDGLLKGALSLYGSLLDQKWQYLVEVGGGALPFRPRCWR